MTNLRDKNDFSTITMATGASGKELDDLIAKLVARDNLKPEAKEPAPKTRRTHR